MMKRICGAMLFVISLGCVAMRAQDAGSIYAANCANCHGLDGSGNTVLGRALKLRDLRSAETQKRSQDELVAIIGKGAGRGKMPAFQKKLGDETVGKLAAYLRGLEAHPAHTIQPTKTANLEPTDAKGVYAAKCAHCHAADGSGDTVLGRTIKIHDLRSAVRELSDEQIIEIIANGTDRGRMAGFQKKLGPEMVEQLAAFVRVLSGQPATTVKEKAIMPQSSTGPAPEPATAAQQPQPSPQKQERQASDVLASAAPANPASSLVQAKKQEPKSKSVDLNSASKETLMKLPGITEAEAEHIIAGRPYKSSLQFKIKNIIPVEKYTKIAALVVAKQPKRITGKPAP